MTKKLRFLVLIVMAALLVLLPACKEDTAPTKENKKPAISVKYVTMKAILSANHPEKRLGKKENLQLVSQGDKEYTLFLDGKDNIFESYPAEDQNRLTIDLSYEITKKGSEFSKNSFSIPNPEEEWLPYLLFPSTFSFNEKIQAREEKDGKFCITTKLSGGDYDISLNLEDTVTDYCETVYTLDKETLAIEGYKTTIYALDGTSISFDVVITKNVEVPESVELLKNYNKSGTVTEETDDSYIEDGDDDPSGDDSSGGSSSNEDSAGNSSSGSSSSGGSSSDDDSAGSSSSGNSSSGNSSSGSSSKEDPEEDSSSGGSSSTPSEDDDDDDGDDDSSSLGSKSEAWFYKDDDELNLLLIGNSYSTYWTGELWGLLDAAGYRNVTIANVYYSGCTFEQHWTWYENKESNYKFYVTRSASSREEYRNQNLEFALLFTEWDAISLQQSNKWAGSEEKHRNSITPYIPKIDNLLRSYYPKAKIFWQQDWAHEIGGGPSVISTQEKHTRVYLEVGMEFCRQYNYTMVPLGEAWPLVRHDPLFYDVDAPAHKNTPRKSLHTRIQHAGELAGEIINTDLSHDGDIGGGQYLNGCVWFEMLTGESVVGNTFRPFYEYKGQQLSLTKEQIAALQNAAHTAVQNTRNKGYIS